MLQKQNNIYTIFTLLLTLLFCLPIVAQQQSVNSTTKSNSATALGKAKQPDAPSAIAERFFNGLNADDNYGQSVSSAGDVNGDGYDDLIIGAAGYDDGSAFNAGRAYIYFGGNIINNIPDVILTGETNNNLFGLAVSTAGDVNGDGYSDVIIGALGNNSNTGKSYIFFGSSSISGNINSSSADVTMTGETTNNSFGGSVSTAGDVNGDGYGDVIVGAKSINSNTGKSYIFFGSSSISGNINALSADVTMTGETTNNIFGGSVSTAGDINGDGYGDVIVGAVGTTNSTGTSYVYFGSSSFSGNINALSADVIMTGETIVNYFGLSVSTAGDVNGDGYSDVIVGARGNNSAIGKSYIFLGSPTIGGSVTATNADVKMTGEAASDNFGRSVSTAGDVNGDGYSDVIVGAYFNDAGGIDAGRSYIYYGGLSMDNIADVTMSGETSSDQFGYSVSTAGDMNGDGYDDFIVGAIFNDINGSNSGRAYLYLNSLTGSDITDDFFTGEAANNLFGIRVSTAGDVNGDGYSDVIVGAYGNNGSTGKSYIYFGGHNRDNIADVTMTGEATSNVFGNSVSSAGDVNGDGYNDVIVGANGNNSNTGKSYIFFGGSSISGNINASLADVTMTGEATNNSFGSTVSSAGDVNGDGYSDVIVGASGNNSNTGKSYIFFGGSSISGNINASSADVIMIGESTSTRFGFSVSSAGDVNGDGYSDVIVGASANNSNTGKSYIFFGGSSISGNINASLADVTMTGEVISNNFGISVSSAGDVNGDSYSDVIVGASGNNSNTGKSYIFFGNSSISGNINASSADVTMTGEATSNFFGSSVSSAGDVNGDGYNDVIVGATGNNSFTGKSYIYFGNSSISGNINVSSANVTMTGEATNNYFGRSVSSAGDVNGDGYSDVIVGAYRNDAGGSNAGRSYLYISSSPPINPRIASVKDVPGDQGSYATVKWVRSGYDSQEADKITGYDVYRSHPPAGSGFAWQYLTTIPSAHYKFYSYDAIMPYDSSANTSGTFYFNIVARTANSSEFWKSDIVYGHSVDNLAPGAPSGFAANSSGGDVALHWHPNTESDLYNYILYRSSTPTIDLNTASPIANLTDTLFTDTNPPAGEVYYFIVAQDIHNNVSPLATAGGGLFVEVGLTILLEGPYNSSGNMNANLTVPNISPYNSIHVATVIPAGVVDWVFIELRDKNNSSTVLGSVSAFVKTDGTIVSMFGNSSVFVPVMHPMLDKYFIVIKHRNHLGVMSSVAVDIN